MVPAEILLKLKDRMKGVEAFSELDGQRKTLRDKIKEQIGRYNSCRSSRSACAAPLACMPHASNTMHASRRSIMVERRRR